nr:hypothetical protein [Acinetobacter baumannii]
MENIMIVDVGCTFWTLEKIFQNAHQNKGFVVLPAKDIKPLSTVRKLAKVVIWQNKICLTLNPKN